MCQMYIVCGQPVPQQAPYSSICSSLTQSRSYGYVSKMTCLHACTAAAAKKSMSEFLPSRALKMRSIDHFEVRLYGFQYVDMSTHTCVFVHVMLSHSTISPKFTLQTVPREGPPPRCILHNPHIKRNRLRLGLGPPSHKYSSNSSLASARTLAWYLSVLSCHSYLLVRATTIDRVWPMLAFLELFDNTGSCV